MADLTRAQRQQLDAMLQECEEIIERHQHDAPEQTEGYLNFEHARFLLADGRRSFANDKRDPATAARSLRRAAARLAVYNSGGAAAAVTAVQERLEAAATQLDHAQ
jgi:hypothetical protein